jgi:hypothetical protein
LGGNILYEGGAVKKILFLLPAILFLFSACKGGGGMTELKSYPIKDMEGLITRDGVEFDPSTSADGNGSLKITATAPRVVRLFETGGLDVENAILVYNAKIKNENLQGTAFLEMWVSFPGKGEFFSRGLQNPVTGTMDWSSAMTPFFLKRGENPDNVKLNLVVNGTGTVWIDDIKLAKGPLR